MPTAFTFIEKPRKPNQPDQQSSANSNQTPRMCNPVIYLCQHLPTALNPTPWLSCPTHPTQYHRNRIIPMSFACKPAPGTIVMRRPPVQMFCQRCCDKWRLGGLYEQEATESIARVDRALAGTEFRLTREDIQEGLRKADELFRCEGF
ncbi:uncharacterized protein EAE98_010112 [Botrytis deweyae]|uniref:Uncharacterized protein n=1 Tax=Botrytis deweyae TaxID=2478750 RepID=A0ABQ7IA35_9HELO|nr:uncharacterized protein EAE98_010112 [Botrytis deweyae]KAF7917696.1 hypothetical protein EAE98_010112 [Botrytis deweyae]